MVDGPDTGAWVEAYNDPPGDQSAYYFATDATEAAKMTQFYPTAGARPWWESLAQYGVTKAIDAHYAQPPQVNTSTPGTYAGANGRTYTQGRASIDGEGGQNLLLIALAGLAFFALG